MFFLSAIIAWLRLPQVRPSRPTALPRPLLRKGGLPLRQDQGGPRQERRSLISKRPLREKDRRSSPAVILN